MAVNLLPSNVPIGYVNNDLKQPIYASQELTRAFTTMMRKIGGQSTALVGSVTSLAATPFMGGIIITGVLPTEADLAYVELYESTTSNFADAVLYTQGKSSSFNRSGLAAADGLHYYWVRCVNTAGDLGALTEPVSATALDPIAGADAQLLTLSASGFAFVYADAMATTTLSPDITFTAVLQNLVGTATFVAEAFGGITSSIDANALLVLNAEDLTDSSLTPKTITAFGDAVVSPSLPKYGNYSFRMPSGAGGYLTAGVASDWNFMHRTAATWTWEAFCALTDFASEHTLFSTSNGSTGDYGLYCAIDASRVVQLQMYRGVSSSLVINGGFATALPNDTAYHHVAITWDESAGVATLWIDGVSGGTLPKLNPCGTGAATATMKIGAWGAHANYKGYMDGVRVSNVVRYAAPFTPPNNAWGSNTTNGSLGFITLGGSGNTRTLTGAQFNSLGLLNTQYVSVEASLGGFSDATTIYRGQTGSDAIGLVLSNQSVTVPADSSGVVSDFSAAVTDAQVWKGITNDTSDWSFSKVDSGVTTTMTGTGTSKVTITATAMSADVATVTVTATKTGYPNQVRIFYVNKSRAGVTGATGSPGSRGSLTGYGAAYGISSSSWSDLKANRVISNIILNQALTTDLATTGHLQSGDTVTLSNGTSFSGTKFWNGSAWTTPGTVVDGTSVVPGTLPLTAVDLTSRTAQTSTDGGSTWNSILLRFT